ncbi:MAG: hypothetical protein OZ923_13045 [Comamonadaceae bacterium]|nr:hypothetical protein [Burkholderiales bacterium]MEB2349523.1 hypothetical protein [Comamonadaceae bacterium]
MLGSIPFEIPAEFATRMATGELLRYGAILKDAGTGQIVGHLQETGLLQAALSSVAGSPFSLVSDALNLGSNLYTAVQITQIKAVMHALQTLQIGTLGVSLAGVGVSVAGFMYMRRRFNALDKRLDEIINEIRKGFEEQRQAEVRKHISRTNGLLERAARARDLSDPAREYRDVAAALTDEAAYFCGEIAYLRGDAKALPTDLFWQLAQSFMLSNNARIDCSMRGNELQHALRTAETIERDYRKIFNPLTPISFNCDTKQGMTMVQIMRDATDSAACKPYLIDELRMRRLQGDVYIEALEQETIHPFMVLPAH